MERSANYVKVVCIYRMDREDRGTLCEMSSCTFERPGQPRSVSCKEPNKC